MNKTTQYQRLRRGAVGLLLALMATTAVSCSKKLDQAPVFPVTGKLVDGGQPAVKAMLFFHPVKNEPKSLRPLGKVAADGSIRVSTYTADDGAPAGQYIITAIWPDPPAGAPPDTDEAPDRLAGRCTNPKTSPWRVTIEEKPNDLGTLDIQVWPKGADKPSKDAAKSKPPAVTPE